MGQSKIQSTSATVHKNWSSRWFTANKKVAEAIRQDANPRID